MDCADKQYYADENSVATAAAYYEGLRGDKLYWYECPTCNGFHLTHSDYKKSELYYSTIKAAIVKKNIRASKINLDNLNAFPNMDEIRSYRNSIRDRGDLEEIAKWNEENPSAMISIKRVKAPGEKEYIPADVVRIKQMRSLIVRMAKTPKEINQWNKEYPKYKIEYSEVPNVIPPEWLG